MGERQLGKASCGCGCVRELDLEEKAEMADSGREVREGPLGRAAMAKGSVAAGPGGPVAPRWMGRGGGGAVPGSVD